MAKTFLKPINVPKEIAVTCEGNLLSFKGKLGEITLDIHPDVKILEEKGYDPIVEANFDDGMWEVEAYKDGKRWELIINRDSGKIMNEWIDN